MITDDELLLYHYRDGLDATERARIGTALSEQPEVPVPELTQRRWQVALERAARQDDKGGVHVSLAGRRWSPRWPSMAAAATVAAVALFLVIPDLKDEPPVPETSHAPAGTADASAYERGLKVHLESTERQLAGLDSATPEQRARLIETIIAQNRIYALAAERAGEPQLARVLRAFSPILQDLGQGRGDSSASIAQLNFELRVMKGRLSAADASPNTHSTTL